MSDPASSIACVVTGASCAVSVCSPEESRRMNARMPGVSENCIAETWWMPGLAAIDGRQGVMLLERAVTRFAARIVDCHLYGDRTLLTEVITSEASVCCAHSVTQAVNHRATSPYESADC
jgi:hypothetical protein